MPEPVLIVIPARAASTRFPLKPLAPIAGKPMIQHVWERAQRARRVTRVVVATDDTRIQQAVQAFGGEAFLTGPCDSGTDRVARVAREIPHPYVINLQGDEPLIDPASLDALVDSLDRHPQSGIATLAVRRLDPEGLGDPNTVKVVITPEGQALYFSRCHLKADANGAYLKHIGIYAFRRQVLEAFCQWEPSALEKAERLEQLRALERGVPIQVIVVERDTVSVDIPSDIARAEHALKEKR